MWKALVIGSYGLLLQGCAPSRQEIDAMPTTQIEDINNKEGSVVEQQVVKVNGFVEDLGRSSETGNALAFIAKEKITTHHYILRSSLEKNSPSVDMIAIDEQTESGTNLVETIIVNLPIRFPKFDPNHKFEILGKVVSGQEGKVLEISRYGSGILDLTATKAEKE
jgi:hypothetical protein